MGTRRYPLHLRFLRPHQLTPGRSGKSSIQKVMFEKFSPAETLFLDTTSKIESATME
jgi:hypothetical protein